MRRIATVYLAIVLAVLLMSSASASDQEKNGAIDPNKVVKRWKAVGLAVEIPWRRSSFPSEDYTYLSQCRQRVGSNGSSGFQTEIECEILGHSSSAAHQVSVGIEVWNPRSEIAGQQIAVDAIEAIGVEVPDVVVEAFRAGRALSHGDWEVADESNDRLKEIRVYYRPGENTSATTAGSH